MKTLKVEEVHLMAYETLPGRWSNQRLDLVHFWGCTPIGVEELTTL